MASTAASSAGGKRAGSGWAAAIDVGASKAAVLIGELDPMGDLLVRGLGLQSPRRNNQGTPADFDAAARALRVALDQAERMSGVFIDTAIASYSGPGVRSTRVFGAAKLFRPAVDRDDVRAALAAARDAAAANGRVALHVAPVCYHVDDGPPLHDPRGERGRTLSADVLVVTAPAAAVEGLEELGREAGVRLTRIVAAPYAAGLGGLSPEEREQGRVLLDLGAGATGLAAFRDGALLHCETIPLGGLRITEEVAAQFGTSFAAAERAKIAFGGVLGPEVRGVRFELPRLGPQGRLEASSLDVDTLQRLMAPAIREIFERAHKRSRAAGLDLDLASRLALCGGGALLAMAPALAEQVFACPVEVCHVEGLELTPKAAAAPAFAVAGGLLRYALHRPPEAAAPARTRSSRSRGALPPMAEGPSVRGAVGKAWGWLRENL